MGHRNKYVLLMGVSLDSLNRGVNALGIGAVNTLHSNLCDKETVIMRFASDEKKVLKKVWIGGVFKEIETVFFSRKSYLFALVELLIRRLIRFEPSGKLSKFILSADGVYNVNAGDSFSDIYGMKKFFRTFIESLIVIIAKKKMTFLPQTIGPFNTAIGRALARYVLRRLDKIYVRDGKANDFLRAINRNAVTCLDLASDMPSRPVRTEYGKDYVGLNVNGLLYFGLYKSNPYIGKTYRTLISNLLEKLFELNSKVVLIPHTYSVDKRFGENDLEAIRHLHKNDKRFCFINEEFDAQELKFIISNLSFFIGSRMHACIAALSQSVPTVALAYSYKFEGTFDMFGMKDCVFNINGIGESDVEYVVAELIKRVAARGRIREHLCTKNTNRNPLCLA